MGEAHVSASVDLFWLPLGAGGHFVRWNGRLYEWWSAWREHRAQADLYHCGLAVPLDSISYAVEMGPVWNVGGVEVARSPPRVSLRDAVLAWGYIPDITEAVESPLIGPPRGGRAPGWTAGLVLAERQARSRRLDLGSSADDREVRT